MKFNYTIHYTGSSGNCASIYYDNIGLLVDIGKPYKYLEPFLYDKQFIFISHRHQDHLVYSTYKKIRENFPFIQFIGNNDVNENLLKRDLQCLDLIVRDNFQFQIGDVKFTTLQNYHGTGEEYAETHGIILESPYQNLLFATDISTMIDYEKYLSSNHMLLDIILLESNYDPYVIEFYESVRVHTGYSVFSNGSYRHLSTIDRDRFVSQFKHENTIDCELHQSKTYRSFDGLIKKSKGKVTREMVTEWQNRRNYK